MGLSFDPIAEARRNWERLEWGAVDAMTAATSITRAHQILLYRINEALAPLNLTFSRFEALALLYFSRAGALPLGKIGERLQVHPTSVTNTIDRLQADELVVRLAHPTDRRTTLAAITAEGSRVVQKAADELAAIQFGLTGMTARDRRAINDAILALRSEAGDF